MPLTHTHSKFTTLRIVFSVLLFIVSGCHKSDSALKLYVFDFWIQHDLISNRLKSIPTDIEPMFYPRFNL